MSLAGVIATFKTGDYTVTRTATGTTDTSGIYSSGGTSTFSISASVQPLSGRDLKDLAEGMRADDFRTVWTLSELISLKVSNTPDVILIDGDHYRVNTVKHRTILSNFYRCIVERTDVP